MEQRHILHFLMYFRFMQSTRALREEAVEKTLQLQVSEKCEKREKETL